MTSPLLRTAVATALALGALGLTQPARATPSDGVHTVRVPDGDPHDRSLAPRTTEPFSLIGVTWDDPDAGGRGPPPGGAPAPPRPAPGGAGPPPPPRPAA
ncbi:hypothetical protein ACFV16_14970 [Streptomyces massasporeus]|uniref:hypothetical protein n=1 Tax=Streptomyces massasporeus TaxID=67324 RepID=UPI003692F48B